MTMRLVLADDHPLFLDGLEQLLRLEPDLEVVARCIDGEEALRAVRDLKPDILLLDLHMPGKDGLAVLRELARERSPTRVVLLTAALHEDDVLEALQLGVKGVVLKEMAPRLLIQCLRKVHAGGRWVETRSTAKALDRLLQREAGSREAAGVLTQRETEIVRLVASGLQNKEIAQRLAITEGTVKVHVHSIYLKLKVSNRVGLMRWAEERGLV
jgi:two-component system, NarL family, nitrate/nitrite response regulator NarL